MNCKTCRYFDEIEDTGIGYCHRYPPKWQQVCNSDWCGEFFGQSLSCGIVKEYLEDYWKDRVKGPVGNHPKDLGGVKIDEAAAALRKILEDFIVNK